MRNWVLATMLVATAMLVVAGCHAGPCGGCADYETCNTVSNMCVLNTGARFDLYATSGHVDGDSWDPFFGPPDPYVCVTVPGQQEYCTSPQSDTHSPKWNEQLVIDLDGDTLEATSIAVRYEDSDLDSPDHICSGHIQFTAEFVHDAGLTMRCSNGASAGFELKNTARGTPAF
jgi:hypothetical protein